MVEDMGKVQEDDNFVVQGPVSKFPIPRDTIGRDAFTELSKCVNNSVAMIDAFSGKQLLRSDLFRRSLNLAQALRVQGYLGQDTVISVSSENTLEFYIPIFAAFFNGLITAPINHNYTPLELQHTLNISRPKIVFCSKSISQKYIDLKRDNMKCIHKIIILDPKELESDLQDVSDVFYMEDYVQGVLRGKDVDAASFQPVDGDPSEMAAFILSSSGTTGLPKGVMLSHLNIMVRMSHFRDSRYHHANIEEEENVLGLMPFFHSYGLQITLGALINHQTVICLRKFDEDVFLRSIQDFKITTLALAPPLAVFLAKTTKIGNYDLSSVKDVFCGAAPLSKNTEDEVSRRLKCGSMRQGYGLTETTLAVMIVTKSEYKPGSCGKMVPFMTCKVRDPDTGKSLGSNQVGELCFKGPLVMMGYYKNEQATKDTFTSDGWLKTGDLGYYDQDQYFFIVDRLKELIKYKAYQVAPAELEAILINHPNINDVGVVGLPDELVGERPLAFVVKKEEVDITGKDIQKYVADKVSPQKRLSGGVIFVNSIPKNPSGKILRRELREMLKNIKTANKFESKL